MVHVSRDACPVHLSEWLLEEGLTPQGEWITLHRGTETVLPSSPADLRVERVEPTQAACFAETLCRGYGMPDDWAPLYEGIVGRDRWHHYMLSDGEVRIATSSLFINGRSAWCGNSGTLQRYRRRGLHATLSRFRLRDGIEAGCELFTGETWMAKVGSVNPSLRNHMRDSWREAYIRTNYAPAPGWPDGINA